MLLTFLATLCMVRYATASCRTDAAGRDAARAAFALRGRQGGSASHLASARAKSGAKDPAPTPRIEPALRIATRPLIHGRAIYQQRGIDAQRWPQELGLQFLDDERLILSFVGNAEKPTLLPRGEEHAGEEHTVNAIVLSPTTGRVLREAAWPATSPWSRVLSAADAGLILQSGDRFELVTPELAIAKTLLLPPPPPPPWAPGAEAEYLAYASPDGSRLLVTGTFKTSIPWRWVDAQSMEVLTSFRRPPGEWNNPCVSRDRIWAALIGGNRFLWTRTPATEWRRMALPQFDGDETDCWSGVGPGMVYGVADRRDLPHEPIDLGGFIANGEGGNIWKVETDPKEGGPGRAAVSRRGKRFVVLVEKLVGGIDWLDVSGHTVLRGVLIYDSPFGAAPRHYAVAKSNVREIYATALSPDGRHLAVLGRNEVIEVFDLPPAPAELRQ
ncbi:MAG: hypothetical protein ACRD1E_06500 [Terriglobales bacterium]